MGEVSVVMDHSRLKIFTESIIIDNNINIVKLPFTSGSALTAFLCHGAGMGMQVSTVS